VGQFSSCDLLNGGNTLRLAAVSGACHKESYRCTEESALHRQDHVVAEDNRSELMFEDGRRQFAEDGAG
jgi:hypothetical protein